MDPAQTNPIIAPDNDAPADSCSFDSQCALPPKTRFQIAAFAAIAIAIVSLAMYGFYWIAMKYF
ncbi:MAG: hypothetical protein C4516_01285 [Oxalobacter sp.]|nr:MAG: hypothetical protein C4516_01285 [Oxalobacter sp.]